MQRALQHAVTRHAAAGTAIRWASGVLVPDDARCLCLVEAAEESAVLYARDTAGLHTAVVRRAYVLPEPEPVAPAAHSEFTTVPAREESS